MPTQIFTGDEGKPVLVIHEPGNMTRYVGGAFKIQDGPVGFKDHWVVSFPTGGGSLIIEEGMHLHWSYIYEKAGMRAIGHKWSKSDISELTKMIAMMVPRTTVTTITDATGHLTEGNDSAEAH